MSDFELAIKQAYSRTERQLKSIEEQILEELARAQKEIQDQVAALYARVLSGVAPADMYNIVIQYNRLNSLLKTVEDVYTKYAKKYAVLVGDSGVIAAQSYYKFQYVLTWFADNVGVNLGFSVFNPDIVRFAVQGLPEIWKQIKDKYPAAIEYKPPTGTLIDLLKKNVGEALQGIRSAITQALIQGRTLPELAQELRKLFTTDAYKSLRIARTEAERLLNIGHYQSSLDAIRQGLQLRKKWLATLDFNTRDSHRSLDGQVRGMNDYFRSPFSGNKTLFPGGFGIAKEDCNCRCSYIDLIKGLEPTFRRGKNPITGKSEIFEWKEYDAWLKGAGAKIGKNGIILLPKK